MRLILNLLETLGCGGRSAVSVFIGFQDYTGFVAWG